MVDPRMLRAYNRELEHVRESGAEFASAFPKIAGRLGMKGVDCADPYVERLLESFAFLTARVQVKLDAEFERFTQHLLDVIYPDYLNPLPSMCTVQVAPKSHEGSLQEGIPIPRGTKFRNSMIESGQTRCTYTSAHDVVLWPIEITEVSYHTRDIASLGLEQTHDAKAALRIRLRSTIDAPLSTLPIDHLDFHVRGVAGEAMRIYEQVFAQALGVVLHDSAKPPSWSHFLEKEAIAQLGFADAEALLPYRNPSFQGHRLLGEYFAFPERFMYFRVSGLRRALSRAGTQADITILMKQSDVELEDSISARNVSLYCTPVINLFEKRLDRIHLSNQTSELHIVPDRVAPMDFEIHSIREVRGYGSESANEEMRFEPFYRARDTDDVDGGRYFTAHRQQRLLSDRERRQHPRSLEYLGSELFLSLVDEHEAPFAESLRQVGVTALCTNRDLPISMTVGVGATDFTIESGVPIESIKCLGQPTTPSPSHALGPTAWRLISHLTPNYFSLVDSSDTDGAAAMRELLELYGEVARPDVKAQIAGVRSIRARPAVQRISGYGPVSYARGLEIEVQLDDRSFEGSGVFLLGAVLDHFLARYVTINVFTQCVVHSTQRGEVMRWPARIGHRHTI